MSFSTQTIFKFPDFLKDVFLHLSCMNPDANKVHTIKKKKIPNLGIDKMMTVCPFCVTLEHFPTGPWKNYLIL